MNPEPLPIIKYIGKCVYCGSTESLTDEHVVPRGLKGPWALVNDFPAIYEAGIRDPKRFNQWDFICIWLIPSFILLRRHTTACAESTQFKRLVLII